MGKSFGYHVKGMLPGFEEKGLFFKKQVFSPQKFGATVLVAAGIGAIHFAGEQLAQVVGERVAAWRKKRAELKHQKEQKVHEHGARRDRDEQRAAVGG